jgi:uncharacterized membrane protein
MSDDLLARAVIFIVMVSAGGVILWTAQAAASGRLGRNSVSGIRLPVTMASDKAWLVAHQAARRPTAIAGWIAIASAAPALLPLPLEFVVASTLVGAVTMLVLVLHGAAVGARAAYALEDEG